MDRDSPAVEADNRVVPALVVELDTTSHRALVAIVDTQSVAEDTDLVLAGPTQVVMVVEIALYILPCLMAIQRSQFAAMMGTIA